jgi:hypothetical protein
MGLHTDLHDSFHSIQGLRKQKKRPRPLLLCSQSLKQVKTTMFICMQYRKLDRIQVLSEDMNQLNSNEESARTQPFWSSNITKFLEKKCGSSVLFITQKSIFPMDRSLVVSEDKYSFFQFSVFKEIIAGCEMTAVYRRMWVNTPCEKDAPNSQIDLH